MKKKIDAMTVISIVLIVINLLLFFVATVNRGSCEAEFVNGISLSNFVQLFSSTVYAMAIQPTNIGLDGIIRSCNWSYTNDKQFLVFYSDSISNNKTFLVRC